MTKKEMFAGMVRNYSVQLSGSRPCWRTGYCIVAAVSRAIALCGKIGFVREGVLRDHVLIDGRYQDLIMMAMIRRQAG